MRANKQTIFIDLDGVMADFDEAFPRLFGVDHKSMLDDDMWSTINSAPDFFRNLPPVPGAIDFFRSVGHLHPVILTACPKSNYVHVARQKRAWVREHLSEDCVVLPMLQGRNKFLFMHRKGDILIDDYAENCRNWNDAGGHAVQHVGNWGRTAGRLLQVLS